jgi:hypothetical protein
MKPSALLIISLLSPLVTAAEKTLIVPSDSKAQYSVLEKDGVGDDRTIITKRTGSSGTSYSKRLYNCANSSVMYLGTGDSMAEMESSKPDPGMSPIVERSIAYYVGIEACR